MNIRHFLLIGAICAAGALYARSGMITIDGKDYPIDTVESYKVGPGSVYSRYNVKMSSTRTVKLYMLETDLTNPYVKVEQRNAKGVIGTYERIVDGYTAMEAPGHRMVGCVNCNFFWTASSSSIGLAGNPTGGTATDGVLSTQPDEWNMGARNTGIEGWNDMGYVMIDRSGKCIIDNMEWDGKISIGGATYNLRDCNRQRTDPWNDEIALFNFRLGTTPTRTFSGTEIIFTVDDWRINGDMTCTVAGVNHTGGTILTDRQGALQCRGTGADFVSGLTPGSTFGMNLGIYSSHDASRPDILQMCMGNALCMVNGELTQRNTNEDYNTQVYARTGMATNNDGSKLWMLVMQTPGMSTTEMCYIFKAAGATYAVGCDGGGSAQMGLLGEVMNTTTEATPRALNNGMWVFTTAPDREEAGQLAFVDDSPMEMPAYSSYTPQMRAYTAEGNFLTHDYKQYTLRCEPASLGTISADGLTFTANPVDASGKLIAEYGTALAEKTITIKDGEVQIRLDSVLVGNEPYAVEVNAIAGDLVLPIQSKALTWQSDDETVATVTDGQVEGQQNGRTVLHGTLGAYSDDIIVNVELATAHRHHPDGSEISGDWAGRKDTTFSCTSTRNVNIEMALGLRLYGCPDSVLVVVNSTAPIGTMTCFMRANDKTEPGSIKLADAVTAGVDYTYTLTPSQMVNAADKSSYPLTLESLKFALKDPKKNKDYTITVKEVVLCFNTWKEASGWVQAVRKQGDGACRKVMVKGKVYLIDKTKLIDILGHEIIW